MVFRAINNKFYLWKVKQLNFPCANDSENYNFKFIVNFTQNDANFSPKTYGRKCIEAIVDNDGILWLNKKHQEEGSDHKSLLEITIK